MKKIREKIPFLLSLTFGTILFGIIFYSMLTPPIRGIANQGDFERMMTWIGATYQNTDDAKTHFHWVNRYFTLSSPQVGTVISSEIPLLFLARIINTELHPEVFDLNILGILHALLFSIILSVNFYYLRKYNAAYGYLFIPFAAIVLTDIVYTAYFNSLYQEPAGMLFLFATLAIIIKTIQEKNTNTTTVNMLLYCIFSLLLISAKAQYFILCIPIILTLYMIFYTPKRKLLLGLLSVFITMFSFAYYFLGTPKIVKDWNIYNSVCAQVLNNTNNPERALRILRLDQKFLKYQGLYAEDKNSGINDPELQQFFTPGVFPNIILYYIQTPKEFISLAKKISNYSFSSTVGYLGYYENTLGHSPGEQPKSFTLWSNFKKAARVHGSQIVALVMISSFLLLLYVYLYKKNIIGAVILFITVSACAQFLLIAFSEGTGGSIEKVLLLFDLLFDLLLFIFVLCIYSCIQKIVERGIKRNKSTPELSLLITIFSNREKQFDMSLHSLTKHRFDARLVELIIFIDYPNYTPILKVIKKYRRYFSGVTVFTSVKKRAPIHHSASRRNFLATKAKGNYILFSEPEMFHINNSIQLCLSHIARRAGRTWLSGPVYAAEDVVGSKGELIDTEKPLQSFSSILHIPYHRNFFTSSRFKKHYHLIDNALYDTPFYFVLFERKFFLGLKGLNQNLKVRGYEEMEFYRRFSGHGGKIIIDPSLTLLHLPHKRSLNKESQVGWNLYNSTVAFDANQHVGQIDDAEVMDVSKNTP